MFQLAIASLIICRIAYTDMKSLVSDYKRRLVQLSSGVGFQEHVIEFESNNEEKADVFVRL